MGKATVIPKVRFHHPGEAAGFSRFLRYLQTRKGARQWVDHGLGSQHQEIGQRCEKWQSRRVIGRNYVIAPDPELLEHIPDELRAQVIANTTEATMFKWFGDNGWGKPEFSYILHDKAKNDMPMMHAHIITPGMIQPDPDVGRMPHFVSKPHIEDLHRTAAASFRHELERVLGKDRTQQILRERDDRIARQQREAWMARQGITPARQPSEHEQILARLFRMRALMNVAKPASKNNQRQRSKGLKQAAKHFRNQRLSERSAALAAARTQRQVKRETDHQQALAQVRQQHRDQLAQRRAHPITDRGRQLQGRDREIER